MARWVKFLLLSWPAIGGSSQVELLRCISEVKSVADSNESSLFLIGGLAFGVRDGLLVVANEREVQAFRFSATQKNSVRFLMPSADPRRPAQMVFLTLHHSEVFGSQVVDLSLENPAPTRRAAEYRLLTPLAKPPQFVRDLLSQLVEKDLVKIAKKYSRGELSRAELLSGNLSLCRDVARLDPLTHRRLNLQINELELVSSEVATPSRAPASLGF